MVSVGLLLLLMCSWALNMYAWWGRFPSCASVPSGSAMESTDIFGTSAATSIQGHLTEAVSIVDSLGRAIAVDKSSSTLHMVARGPARGVSHPSREEAFHVEWQNSKSFCLRWLHNMRLVEVAPVDDEHAFALRLGEFGCTKATQRFELRGKGVYSLGTQRHVAVLGARGDHERLQLVALADGHGVVPASFSFDAMSDMREEVVHKFIDLVRELQERDHGVAVARSEEAQKLAFVRAQQRTSQSSASTDGHSLVGAQGSGAQHSAYKNQSCLGAESHQQRLALVLPFIDTQVWSRLRQVMQRWSEPKYAPCAPGEILPATALFYHPLNSSGEEETVRALWSNLSPTARRCFGGGMNIIYASIEPAIAMAHPDGTCAQFYALFGVLKGSFDSFFLMEPDATPIKNGWLTQLVRLSSPSERRLFWMRGSISRCNGEYGNIRQRADLHINGNALYAVGEPGFDDLLERVRRFYPAFIAREVGYPGCSTGQTGESGFDHSMYQFLRQPSNFDYARTVMSKFQITDFIQNMCEDPFDEADIRRNHPSTYIVHSKWPYFTSAEREARTWFWERMMMWPDKKLLPKLVKMLKIPTRRDELEGVLCSSNRYKALAASNRPLEPCVQRCLRSPVLRLQMPTTCRQASERLRWHAVPDAPKGLQSPWEFGSKPAYVWTSDLHIGPAACYESLLHELGAKLHAEISFSNCVFHPHMCKHRLKVLAFDDWKGFSLDPCPNQMRQRFFQAYKNDEEFRRVDLFVCSHPVANCELYMPFNRSLLVYATTRLEFGRDDEFVAWRKPSIDERSPRRWREWVSNLKAIASRPGNMVAANNLFDVHYIEYHTGIKAEYLPSWCEPLSGLQYAPEKGLPVLLGPYRDNLDYPNFTDEGAWRHPVLQELANIDRSSKAKFHFKRLHELYPKYKWGDVVRHPALVLIPYQVSVMSFFELYRLSIPLFVPSIKLLSTWVRKYGLMWERIYGLPERVPHSAMHQSKPMGSPNSNESLEDWLAFSDYYVFPHIETFDSWPDLVSKLELADLAATSRSMAAFNLKQKAQIKAQWQAIIDKAVRRREGRREHEHLWSGTQGDDFSKAMSALYGRDVAEQALAVDRPHSKCRELAELDQSGHIMACVSSQDALYYGCSESWNEKKPFFWAPDGVNAVSCRPRKIPEAYGVMCPKTRPYCSGYEPKPGGHRYGVCTDWPSNSIRSDTAHYNVLGRKGFLGVYSKKGLPLLTISAPVSGVPAQQTDEPITEKDSKAVDEMVRLHLG
jgi:hypothetical protein